MYLSQDTCTKKKNPSKIWLEKTNTIKSELTWLLGRNEVSYTIGFAAIKALKATLEKQFPLYLSEITVISWSLKYFIRRNVSVLKSSIYPKQLQVWKKGGSQRLQRLFSFGLLGRVTELCSKMISTIWNRTCVCLCLCACVNRWN